MLPGRFVEIDMLITEIEAYVLVPGAGEPLQIRLRAVINIVHHFAERHHIVRHAQVQAVNSL